MACFCQAGIILYIIEQYGAQLAQGLEGGGRHKCLDNAFEKIVCLENLFFAWREFRKGKRNKEDVREFEFALEDNVFALHEELRAKQYIHGKYSSFYVRDPKLRHIHKACVRDRLVHQAIFRVLYHEFDNQFIFGSYSCRIDKGTHRGVNRLEQFTRKATANFIKTAYALKCDIKKFFDNVDHNILRGIIRKTILDKNALWLIDFIIKSFSTLDDKGIPLGNVTSQLFANIYLNELDQYVKHSLREKYYIRYCDDFVILHSDAGHLKNIASQVQIFLERNLKLKLHEDKVIIHKIRQGIDFLGYVALPNYRVMRTKTKHRIVSKMRVKKDQLKCKLIDGESFNQSLQSYLGALSHCKSFKIQKQIKRFMIMFIHGEDNYSSKEYLSRVIDKFKQKHDPNGENVLVFDSEDSDWDSIASAMTGGGLFSSKKLIIAKNILINKELRESLNEFLDAHDLSGDVSLVIYEGASPDKRSALFKRLKKEKFVYEFAALDARAVEGHIARMTAEYNKKINTDACRELSIICGTDLWRAKSEIQKLSSLVEDTITLDDVKNNTQAKLEDDIWKFVDSISSANKAQALDMLEKQIEAGTEPMYLLSMMIRQFRLLITLYEAEGVNAALASSLSLHPFVVKKTRAQAKRFTIDKLKLIYQALNRLDSALKSSKADPKVLFTVLIDSVVR